MITHHAGLSWSDMKASIHAHNKKYATAWDWTEHEYKNFLKLNDIEYNPTEFGLESSAHGIEVFPHLIDLITAHFNLNCTEMTKIINLHNNVYGTEWKLNKIDYAKLLLRYKSDFDPFAYELNDIKFQNDELQAELNSLNAKFAPLHPNSNNVQNSDQNNIPLYAIPIEETDTVDEKADQLQLLVDQEKSYLVDEYHKIVEISNTDQSNWSAKNILDNLEIVINIFMSQKKYKENRTGQRTLPLFNQNYIIVNEQLNRIQQFVVTLVHKLYQHALILRRKQKNELAQAYDEKIQQFLMLIDVRLKDANRVLAKTCSYEQMQYVQFDFADKITMDDINASVTQTLLEKYHETPLSTHKPDKADKKYDDVTVETLPHLVFDTSRYVETNSLISSNVNKSQSTTSFMGIISTKKSKPQQKNKKFSHRKNGRVLVLVHLLLLTLVPNETKKICRTQMVQTQTMIQIQKMTNFLLLMIFIFHVTLMIQVMMIQMDRIMSQMGQIPPIHHHLQKMRTRVMMRTRRIMGTKMRTKIITIRQKKKMIQILRILKNLNML